MLNLRSLVARQFSRSPSGRRVGAVSLAGARHACASVGAALAASLLAGGALAQDEAPSAGEASSAGQLLPAQPATTVTSTSYRNAFVPEPGTNLDAHLPSSAQSKIDINQSDGFDLRPPAGNAPTLRGNPGALGVLGPSGAQPASREAARAFHIVRRGDTLWKICGDQLRDPRLWPRVWSFNPQLQNPHWIYPGDQLRLRAEASSPFASAPMAGARGVVEGGTLGSGLVSRPPSVPPDTVFLRELGYIDDPQKDVWGHVVGAREEQQLLSNGNEVYLLLRPGAEVQLGQELTVFRDVREPPAPDGARRPPGKLVAFQGTVQIDSWDAERRVARGRLTESLDVIERGAKVGPLGRRFYVVPPTTSQVEVRARVLTSMYPHVIMGRDQVVFIDRGANDGLRAGNRLFVVRRGDSWRRTLLTTTRMARDRLLLDVPTRVTVEATPLEGDDQDFPDEVVAELRIVRAHRFSSLALVTRSSEEIEPGDEAVTRKGL